MTRGSPASPIDWPISTTEPFYGFERASNCKNNPYKRAVSMKRKRQAPVLASLTAALFAALLLLLADWTKSQELAAAVNPAVRDRLVAAGGLVEPASQARELAAAVVGRIVKVNFEEGDHVAAGDVIAQIENDDLKAQLTGAEAALMTRENELLRLKTGAREQEISAARAELNEADA